MLNWMGELFSGFADSLMEVLPTSPFAPFIEQFSDLPYLAWLNWFIPIGAAISVLEVWLAAITVFYIYSIILRWIKAIE